MAVYILSEPSTASWGKKKLKKIAMVWCSSVLPAQPKVTVILTFGGMRTSNAVHSVWESVLDDIMDDVILRDVIGDGPPSSVNCKNKTKNTTAKNKTKQTKNKNKKRKRSYYSMPVGLSVLKWRRNLSTATTTTTTKNNIQITQKRRAADKRDDTGN